LTNFSLSFAIAEHFVKAAQSMSEQQDEIVETQVHLGESGGSDGRSPIGADHLALPGPESPG
jgi:hypothetical protein